MGRGHEGHWAHGLPSCSLCSFTPQQHWICTCSLFPLFKQYPHLTSNWAQKPTPEMNPPKGVSCSLPFLTCHQQENGIWRIRIWGGIGGWWIKASSSDICHKCWYQCLPSIPHLLQAWLCAWGFTDITGNPPDPASIRNETNRKFTGEENEMQRPQVSYGARMQQLRTENSRTQLSNTKGPASLGLPLNEKEQKQYQSHCRKPQKDLSLQMWPRYDAVALRSRPAAVPHALHGFPGELQGGCAQAELSS